jgi:uncharacterized membrane-anchored protein YitT (DUF2179 family)
MEAIFHIRFLGTILFLSTFALAVNYIYPSTKKFEVKVNSRKTTELQKELKKSKFNRTYTI